MEVVGLSFIVVYVYKRLYILSFIDIYTAVLVNKPQNNRSAAASMASEMGYSFGKEGGRKHFFFLKIKINLFHVWSQL